MLKQIVFQKFKNQTADYMPAGIWTPDNDQLHMEIKNAQPTAFKLVKNTSANADTSYPFILSKEASSTGSAITGSPVAIVPLPTLGIVAVVTSTFNVYTFDSFNDLGAPTSPGGNYAADITVYNNALIVAHTSVASMYHGAISATPSWTAFGTTQATFKYLEPFSTNCYYTDANSATTDRRLVKFFDTTYTTQAGLDLGTNWYVQGLKNYLSKYLAVFASYYNYGNNGVDETTMFLWNGLAANSYDYALTFKGKYRGSIVFNSKLYVFANQNSDLQVFRLDGLDFTPIAKLYNLDVSQSFVNNPKSVVTTDGEDIYLQTTRGVLCFDPDEGESFFIYNNAATPVSVLFANSSGKYYFGRSSNANFFSWNPAGTNSVSSGSYTSNYVEIPEGRGEISRIELLYSSQPPSSSDTVALTMNYKDDYNDAVVNTYTATTLNSTNTGKSRTVIEPIGARCNKFNITFTVTASTVTWAPIIYKVIVHYKPIAT